MSSRLLGALRGHARRPRRRHSSKAALPLPGDTAHILSELEAGGASRSETAAAAVSAFALQRAPLPAMQALIQLLDDAFFQHTAPTAGQVLRYCTGVVAGAGQSGGGDGDSRASVQACHALLRPCIRDSAVALEVVAAALSPSDEPPLRSPGVALGLVAGAAAGHNPRLCSSVLASGAWNTVGSRGAWGRVPGSSLRAPHRAVGFGGHASLARSEEGWGGVGVWG